VRDNRPSRLALAGLVISALLTGCDQKNRQRAAEQSSGLAPQETASNAPGGGGSEAKAGSALDEPQLVGDWKGESLVQVKNSPAKDETVVWHITKAGGPGALSVSADKIVNGRPIAMGTLAFKYDRARQAIVCEYAQGVWDLTLKGDKLEGTLTRPDGTVFRRVSLERAASRGRT
jgi:hypothetical protein